MRRLFSLSLYAICLACSQVLAGPLQVQVPTDIEPPSSRVTQAEVLADFHLWRLAGLHDLHKNERSPDTDSHAYRKAYATYLHLRNSPQYTGLVEELQKNPNATVVATGAKPPSRQAAK